MVRDVPIMGVMRDEEQIMKIIAVIYRDRHTPVRK